MVEKELNSFDDGLPGKVAVLVSTYNGEKYLKEQIDSILNQKTDFKFDIIVRDDGSTDGTDRILKNYADAGMIQYSSCENVGAAKAFILMLKENVGYDYYAFSDQDDVWNEDKLQHGINAISELNSPALFCSNGELVDEKLRYLGRNVHRRSPHFSLVSVLCLAACAQGCTSVFNRKLAKVVQDNRVPDSFIMHDSLITCLCALIGGEIVYEDIPLMKYRIHSENALGITTARQGVFGTVVDRLREVFCKKKISMYDQVESLLRIYHRYISYENKLLCKTVIMSKKSFLMRLKLVFNRELKHDTLNKTITKKLEILFGND